MAEAMSESKNTAEEWTLPLRLATGLTAPGGARLTEEALRAAAVTIRDHVVHLSPGLSPTTRKVAAASPQSYRVVERDPLARAGLAGIDCEIVDAPVDATGLPESTATVVLAEGVLSGLSDDAAAATLVEAARMLRPRGRLVLHEVAGSGAGMLPGGVATRSPARWSDSVEAAGLVVVGSTEGSLDAGDPWAPVMRAGPRVGLKLGPALVREMSPRGSGAEFRQLRTLSADVLGAVVIFAERPLIMGMRWSGSR